MRRSTRNTRRFRRSKREYIWSSVFVTHDLVLLNGGVDAFPIVTRTDWARDAANAQTIEKGAVVKRIIGDVRVRTDNGAGAPSPGGASYIWALGRFDEDDAQVLNLASSFFGEDWLHTEAGSIDANNATTVAFAPQVSWRHHMDSKAARKLTSEDEIRFCFGGFTAVGGSSASDSLVVDYFFRSLIQLP